MQPFVTLCISAKTAEGASGFYWCPIFYCLVFRGGFRRRVYCEIQVFSKLRNLFASAPKNAYYAMSLIGYFLSCQSQRRTFILVATYGCNGNYFVLRHSFVVLADTGRNVAAAARGTGPDFKQRSNPQPRSLELFAVHVLARF